MLNIRTRLFFFPFLQDAAGAILKKASLALGLRSRSKTGSSKRLLLRNLVFFLDMSSLVTSLGIHILTSAFLNPPPLYYDSVRVADRLIYFS